MSVTIRVHVGAVACAELLALKPPREMLDRKIVEDRADLRKVGVWRIRCRSAGRKRCGSREEPRRTIRRRQSREVSVVVDDIEDVEMVRTQRRFCGSDAAEVSSAIHRGCRRRERGRNIGQDLLT